MVCTLSWSTTRACNNNSFIFIDVYVFYGRTVVWLTYTTGVESGGGGGGWGHVPPTFLIGGGGAMVCLCPPLLTPHFYFPLELYVYITLTNNYLAFFIYQLIILWTISINWHRWLLVNNHIPKYNSFILVLYRRYINYVSVCAPPPPPPPTHTLFDTFLRHCILRICCKSNTTTMPNKGSLCVPWPDL